ncbi:hypothetical protein D3C85_811700 [compost metagenome]
MVDAHQVRIDTVQSAVDDHHGRADAFQALCQATVAAGRGDDQAVDAFFQQHTQVAALLVRIVVGVAQDDAVTVSLAVILDTPGQFGEIRVEAVGDQQADGGRGLGLE